MEWTILLITSSCKMTEREYKYTEPKVQKKSFGNWAALWISGTRTRQLTSPRLYFFVSLFLLSSCSPVVNGLYLHGMRMWSHESSS